MILSDGLIKFSTSFTNESFALLPCGNGKLLISDMKIPKLDCSDWTSAYHALIYLLSFGTSSSNMKAQCQCHVKTVQSRP